MQYQWNVTMSVNVQYGRTWSELIMACVLVAFFVLEKLMKLENLVRLLVSCLRINLILSNINLSHLRLLTLVKFIVSHLNSGFSFSKGSISSMQLLFSPLFIFYIVTHMMSWCMYIFIPPIRTIKHTHQFSRQYVWT
jgi:hypothetical protein